MFVATKGELWTIRSALEEGESETVADALSIVESILDNDLTIEVSNDSPEIDSNGIPRDTVSMKLVPQYEGDMVDEN